jgi:hypothetical protein
MFEECGINLEREQEKAFEGLELTIAPRRIAFFKFILEGYDGLAILSTLDSDSGRVLLRFPACREAEIYELTNTLLQSGQLGKGCSIINQA